MSIAQTILDTLVKPTALGSAALRAQWVKRLGVQAIFSAEVTSKSYLEKLREVAAGYAAGQANKAEGRANLLRAQEALGMPAIADVSRSDPINAMQNIGSGLRMDLQLETIRGQARGMAQVAKSQNPTLARLRPAWRLRSGSWRRNHREWTPRWAKAGQAVNWEGASRVDMVALKTSPIWQELGNAEGYGDGLGQPFPPFAFNSSYTWVDVTRKEAIELGLIKPDKPEGGAV